jgi:2-dehydro-3-deoxyphosphogluconate aldolase / (4S)-4-hydroxy-2-oxoglutarate aldolase
MCETVKQVIEEKRIIVIVRQLYGEKLIKLANALYKGGIRLMEVTFDQSDPDGVKHTAEAIALLKKEMAGKMHVGAGTVITTEQVDAAAAAGAEYIISPNTDGKVIDRTKEKGLISIPAAMTPTEMLAAHNFGADFVKVFPMADLGIKYMKNVMAPISHLRFIAAAGVNEENFGEILGIGFAGAGISGRLTDKKLIEAGDWDGFSTRAEAFCNIAKAYSKEG